MAKTIRKTTIKIRNGKASKPQTKMYVNADYSKIKITELKKILFAFCNDFYAVCKNNGTYDDKRKELKKEAQDLKNCFDFCFSVYRVLDDYNYYKQNRKKQDITLIFNKGQKLNKKNGGG